MLSHHGDRRDARRLGPHAARRLHARRRARPHRLAQRRAAAARGADRARPDVHQARPGAEHADRPRRARGRRSSCASCRRTCPADPPDVVRATIEADLGRPLEEAFAAFELEPLASASVAQAHVAALGDGTEVVVKVQHAGIHADGRGATSTSSTRSPPSPRSTTRRSRCTGRAGWSSSCGGPSRASSTSCARRPCSTRCARTSPARTTCVIPRPVPGAVRAAGADDDAPARAAARRRRRRRLDRPSRRSRCARRGSSSR